MPRNYKPGKSILHEIQTIKEEADYWNRVALNDMRATYAEAFDAAVRELLPDCDDIAVSVILDLYAPVLRVTSGFVTEKVGRDIFLGRVDTGQRTYIHRGIKWT